MTEHPRDDLAAYALGALDDDERRAIETHVDGCAACAREVDAYRSALVAYAEASTSEAPSLRARVVARARADTAGARRERGWTAWLRRPIPAFVPVVLALSLVVSLVALGTARRDADGYAAALSAVVGARTVALVPADRGSDIRGALVLPDGGAPYLLLRMPAPPAGKAWEAWVLRPDAPAAAGLATGGGIVTIALTVPLAGGDGVAVTLEPASGTTAPTSAPVLALPRP